MILPPTSEISHHHKVTNITMSPTSLSLIFFFQKCLFFIRKSYLLVENFELLWLNFNFWSENRIFGRGIFGILAKNGHLGKKYFLKKSFRSILSPKLFISVFQFEMSILKWQNLTETIFRCFASKYTVFPVT